MLRRCAVLTVWLFCASGVRGQGAAGVGAAVPHVALQARAQEMIHQIYAKDFAKTGAADRLSLAKVLLAQGISTTDDAAARYVALIDAGNLAAGAGDAVTAVAAVDELGKFFSVEPLELRREALVRAHGTSTVEQSEAVMRLALETAESAVEVDAFEVVESLTNLGESAAIKSRQVRLVASIQVQLAALRELIAEFGQVKEAYARLKRNERDADAHLVIGRFYGLHKGQWALGLPHLAAASDGELSELAARELARPSDGSAQAALGDAWWEYAEKSSGLTRAVTHAHATEWYVTARKTIQGITLARIESRIAARPAEGAASTARTDVRVDLLAMIDTAKDAAQGTWVKAAGGISCASSPYACLRLPYVVPEEYDLRVSFTRAEGKGPVALLLAANKKAFGFALDVSGEGRFESVDKKAAKDNPTIVPVSVTNGRRYALTVEVRKDRVRALLDGKLLVEWKTDYKDLSRYAVWKLGDATLCGIGANNAKVVFDKVDLVEVTGKGKAAR